MRWSVDRLSPHACGVSASRRTDIPALFARWFERRLEEGFVEYVPPGPPRRVRRSLRPEEVTHFTFWTKWPRPFFPALERVLAFGYPVLWNVTLTGLGGTEVEPYVPRPPRVVASLRELSRRVPPAAIVWRYDPIFLSQRYDAAHHRETFRRLLDAVAGCVDRVAVSFVARYPRQVEPDLRAYRRESGDAVADPSHAERLELAGALAEQADAAGLRFSVCCSPELRVALGRPPAECNALGWARRVYPELAQAPQRSRRPLRPDCACSAEFDIGAYDTCVLGCRYSYGSCSAARARARFARHDPAAPGLVP